MKLIKTAGKTKIVMSRSEWELIGKEAGWDFRQIKNNFTSYLAGLGLATVIGVGGYNSYVERATLNEHKAPFEQSIAGNKDYTRRAQEAKRAYDNNGNMDGFVQLSREIAKDYVVSKRMPADMMANLKSNLEGEAFRYFEKNLKSEGQL
jgi:hypothetical protein